MKRASLWRSLRLAIVSLVMTLPALAGVQASAQPTVTPTSTVSAPPAGNGRPFRFSTQNLASQGYVEEEYLLDGVARAYVPSVNLATVTDGRWDATPTGPTAPYRTRVIIHRPRDAARFNGTVLVEWINVSSGYDFDTFDTYGPAFMRQGYVYIGVSAQAVGVNHMRTWDAGRYGTLAHPGDSYSYDIFSQAVQGARRGALLGDLTANARHYIAWGGSQSGSRLFTYYNAVQPTARMLTGFVPFISAGGAALSQDPLPAAQTPRGAQARIRSDIDTPVLFQISESEVVNAARGIHSQPDSEYFRLWEYAGTSHANSTDLAFGFAQAAAYNIPTDMFPRCERPAINNISAYPVQRAILDAMHVWLTTGRAPDVAPRIVLSIPADAQQPARVVRDPATGIGLGGIRLPQIAVPVGTYWGGRPPNPQQHQACPTFGAMDIWNGDADPDDANRQADISPQPEPNLRSLYRNSSTYVRRVEASARELAAHGYIADYDIPLYVQEARRVQIP